MIVRHLQRAHLADHLGVPLAYELYDQEALAVEHQVSVRTVRRRCEPVACDRQTRAPLYDPDIAGVSLAPVRARPQRTALAQTMRRFQIA